MIEEFNTASILLQSAMDRYLNACIGIKQFHERNGTSNIISSELSTRLASESQMLPLLEAKLKEASVAINSARNMSNHLVPINSIPPELLAHTFHLLLGWQFRAKRTLGSLDGENPNYSQILSHVCSHWRRIAVNSCSLWTHIELRTLDSANQGLIDRARTYATRAGSLLLYIRLTDPPNPGGPRYAHAANLNTFFVPFAARVRSLELVLQNNNPHRVQHSTLSAFLNYCIPGIFTELITNKRCITFGPTGTDEIDDSSPISFIRTSGNSNHEHNLDLFLNIDKPHLERIFRSLTTLCLNRIYPTWSSNAYHNLVELRLTGETSVPEHDLVAILGSSPRIRFLALGVDIILPVPTEILISTVALPELEALHVHGMGHDGLGLLFRWLAPGSKPLQLTLSGSDDDDDFSDDNTKAFFDRSNVTQLYAFRVNNTGVIRLLGLCPHLKTIAMEESDFACTSANGPFPIQISSLRAIYMMHCTIEVHELLAIVKLNNVHTLAFYDCPLYPSQAEAIEEFSTFCPDIRISFLSDRHPIEEWDIFENFEW
ncbi:hypothetical protein B0J17DRAFT_632021 [Rhizoctonia solani]|nr:hypothetical protein B0J17DRAFT_632021 [Rhizoctonia solani]